MKGVVHGLILCVCILSVPNCCGGGNNRGCGHLPSVSPSLLVALPSLIGRCQVLWRRGVLLCGIQTNEQSMYMSLILNSNLE